MFFFLLYGGKDNGNEDTKRVGVSKKIHVAEEPEIL